MDSVKRWLTQQFETRQVEPNSGLGAAITYMTRHWDRLTLFLRQPGAPLDNNLCERALKMAILHRKNSLSYKTLIGAQTGDRFMSLIHTCRLNGVNPFDYLLAIAKHPQQVKEKPEAWLPWNYPKSHFGAHSGPGPPSQRAIPHRAGQDIGAANVSKPTRRGPDEICATARLPK